MRHSVTKQIAFCYGHRLMDYVGKCQHPHGHNGLLEIEVSSQALDARGMVVDFGEIKAAVKAWVDDNLDHQMLLRKDDPLVPVLQGMNEPMFLMDGNPTAENIAKIVFEQAAKQGLDVAKVRLWETPDSYAEFTSR